MKSRTGEWCLCVFLFVILFLVVLEYHRWRSKPYSVFTANKAIAESSALLFCLALALGPINLLTGIYSTALRLRRFLGLTGAFFMVKEFDVAYYWGHWVAWVFGAMTFTGFLFLWTTSYPWALEHFGRDDWKRVHRAGYFFLAMIVLHIVSLGKVANWINWFKTHDQPVPPGTTIPSTAILLVLLLRLADWFIKRRRGTSR
jgi:DMSO/TMAO reductase YedYZ heme-binding membrane subunit